MKFDRDAERVRNNLRSRIDMLASQSEQKLSTDGIYQERIMRKRGEFGS